MLGWLSNIVNVNSKQCFLNLSYPSVHIATTPHTWLSVSAKQPSGWIFSPARNYFNLKAVNIH